jgi:sterol desaturase/sphingolipid hydroxylase (fatty acid hydroxylase superfamily)
MRMIMATALDIVSEIRSNFPLIWDLASAFAGLMVLFVVIFCLERQGGGDLRRFRTRNFLTDSLYALFYQGGIHNKFLYAPVFAGVALVMPSWHLDLIGQLPPPLRFVVFWLVADALGYWVHRWQHNNAFLSSFHSVHHSQRYVTFATTYRNHIVDPLITGFLTYVPLMLLGAPNWYFAPLAMSQVLFEAVKHSDLKWRYGRLYPIFVSPVFHGIHHSSERAQHDSNYGAILAVWDYLFGTMSVGERPAVYGLPGIEGRDTFWGTCIAPFRQLKKLVTGEPVASVERAGVSEQR